MHMANVTASVGELEIVPTARNLQRTIVIVDEQFELITEYKPEEAVSVQSNTNKGAMTLPFQKLGPNIVFNLLPTRGNIKCSTRTIQLHSERARHSPTNKKSLIISQRMKVCQRAELITSSPVKRKRETQQSRSKPVYTTKGKRPKHKTEYEP